jgi:hypothetical protein
VTEDVVVGDDEVVDVVNAIAARSALSECLGYPECLALGRNR